MEKERKEEIKVLTRKCVEIIMKRSKLKDELEETEKKLDKLKYEGEYVICYECGEETKYNSAWGCLCPKHWGD